jgi:hypothetical protein
MAGARGGIWGESFANVSSEGADIKELEQLPTGGCRRSERSFVARAFGRRPARVAIDFVLQRVEEDTDDVWESRGKSREDGLW